MRTFGKLPVAVILLALVSSQVAAQGLLSKPVRLLTPQSPGSASDLILRGVGEVLSKDSGVATFVENRTGASGTIAARACAQAEPDGHTFCMLDAFNVALSPAIYETLPYDSREDLVPVALMGFFPAGLWANAKLPANSMEELLALAKKNPGKLNFATFGAASSSSIYVAWFKNVRGIQFTNVPYKSALDAFRGVIAGETDVGSYALGPAARNSRPGQLKLLAVNNPERVKEFPDTPILSELNIDGVLAWFGLFAPKGTPKEIVERVNESIVKGLMNNPEMRKKFLDNAGIVPSAPAGGSADSFAKFVGKELDVYAKLVKDAGVEKLSHK